MSDDGIDVVRTATGYRLVQLREGAADAVERGCEDCAFLVGYVTLWCNNKAAIAHRGTAYPSTSQCAYWEAPPLQPRQPRKVHTTGLWLSRVWQWLWR